jgi:hypothetical protein
MTELILEPTVTAQWQRLVRDAVRDSTHDLGEDLESYLVFLLMRFAQDSTLTHRVMALEYLKGLSARGEARNNALRDVGDQCLLVAGVFPHQAERRMVRLSYFVELGQSAYEQLSMFLGRSTAQLYGELSNAFVSLIEVLHCMRGLGGALDLTPIEALELWQDTGSPRALKTLRGYTTAHPVSGDEPKTRH